MTKSNRLGAGARMVLAGALTAAVAAWPLACSREGKGSPSGPKGQRAVLVTTAAAATKDVPVELTNLIGTVTARNTVSVQSEVGGKLLKAMVNKGDAVKQGDVLFKIDPEPYKLALDLAKAVYAKDKAQSDFADLTAQRINALFKKGAAGQDEVDQANSLAAAAKASLQADQAAINTAELNLRRTQIISPVAGRVGTVLSEGNTIKADDTALATINQVSPIDVFFWIPQASLPAVQRQMAKGKLFATAILDDPDEAPVSGELTFVDNSADQESLMVRLGATFANENQRLWPPGQGVKVTLRLDVRKGLVTVPAKAVQSGREGKYLFVVQDGGAAHTRPSTSQPADPAGKAAGPELSVEQRKVTAGVRIGDDIVIESGLKAGEVVVTDGQFQLAAGSKVQIKREGAQEGQATADAGKMPAGRAGGTPASPVGEVPAPRPEAEAAR